MLSQFMGRGSEVKEKGAGGREREWGKGKQTGFS